MNEERLDRIESLLERLCSEVNAIRLHLQGETSVEATVESTDLDALGFSREPTGYGIKVLYPDWPNTPDCGRHITFPTNRRVLSASLPIGTKVAVYLSSPVRRIVAAVQTTGTVENGPAVLPNPNPRWPYVIPTKLIIAPRVGVTLDDVGLGQWRLRPGDTFRYITREVYERITAQLKQSPPWQPAE